MNESEKVPRFQHNCPTDGWETCGIAASLLDPHDPNADHGCAKDATRPIFHAEVREVPA
jgi:hypothetical protein